MIIKVKKTEVADMFNFKDVFADTWVSIDDEGRVTGFDNGVVKDRKVDILFSVA